MAGWTLVVSRQEVARVPAERVFARPSERLAGQVLSYVAHRYPQMDAMPWRVAPLGVITVVLDIDTPVRRLVGPDAAVDQRLPTSPIIALRNRPLLLEQAGPSTGISIALTPSGAYALFGRPLRELADPTIGFTDLLGADAQRLIARIAETPGWGARFAVLDDFLIARIAEGPDLAEPVHGAWQLLTAEPGRWSISALADEIGWTRQHLTVRFREQIGLTPKSVARVARLHHAASVLNGPSPPSWSQVALRCGYADQSHLNRDFRELTGCTPTEYLLDPPA